MFCRPPICSCLVVLGALLSLPDLKLSRGCSALCNTCVIPPVSVSNPQLVRKYRCFPAEYHVYGCFLLCEVLHAFAIFVLTSLRPGSVRANRSARSRYVPDATCSWRVFERGHGGRKGERGNSQRPARRNDSHHDASCWPHESPGKNFAPENAPTPRSGLRPS